MKRSVITSRENRRHIQTNHQEMYIQIILRSYYQTLLFKGQCLEHATIIYTTQTENLYYTYKLFGIFFREMALSGKWYCALSSPLDYRQDYRTNFHKCENVNNNPRLHQINSVSVEQLFSIDRRNYALKTPTRFDAIVHLYTGFHIYRGGVRSPVVN